MTIASGRDLALIYFIIIGFVAALIPLAAFALMVMGLRVGRRRMMPYVHLAQFYAARISRMALRASERIAQPFVAAAGISQRVKTVTARLAAMFGIQEG